ncbi:hypothetical protein BC938DRAFT_477827 [Jimgerdemannia flammicorona]|uniref:Uncharacterized protein n=1 Tax=Jimgerdemannia flammicorona TaxID=994334 RepID=A0A433QYQ5_9FUNG|nr:hypothetical protein BC938DRAFT_477827 [Jimgerdemannia flammicorona]
MLRSLSFASRARLSPQAVSYLARYFSSSPSLWTLRILSSPLHFSPTQSLIHTANSIIRP